MELSDILAQYKPVTHDETVDLERVRGLLNQDDPFCRSTLLHVTGSALVVHPETKRVLLRWHERMQSWLQVGGHGDPGEISIYEVALREAREETGLTDVTAWPNSEEPTLLHIVVVPVPAGKGEPQHEHADFRYLLATAHPEAVVEENAKAKLAWLSIEEAMAKTKEDNLRESLRRVGEYLSSCSEINGTTLSISGSTNK